MHGANSSSATPSSPITLSNFWSMWYVIQVPQLGVWLACLVVFGLRGLFPPRSPF